MIKLPNNCYCSDLSVHPKNWDKSRPSLKVSWYIHYRFYDPTFKDDPRYKKGKQRIIKSKFDSFETVTERQEAVRIIMERELHFLKDKGYNLITGQFVAPPDAVCEIHPGTEFSEAMEQALKRLRCEHETWIDIKSVVKYCKVAAEQLRYDRLPVAEIRRRHIKILLEHVDRTRGLSARRFNIYRAYLLKIFKELVELEAVDTNPVRDISKMQEEKKIRPVLNDEQRALIREVLPHRSEEFWMFVNLFFHSGARIKELGDLRTDKVDISRQRYKTIIKKGNVRREVEKTIKDIAMPYWEYFLDRCQPGDYVFGSCLTDHKKPLKSRWISEMWHKHVKDETTGLGINVDFYPLKHLNTSEVVDAMNEQAAADLNSHTSTAMVIGIYDVKQGERKHNKLKGLANQF